jgi:hypothetical protein
MSEERMTEALERTKMAMVRHLEDLNDEVDAKGGRISCPKVLSGMKDAVDCLMDINGMMADSTEHAAVSSSKSSKVSL